MSNARSPRQYTGVRAIKPPDLTIAKRAPTGSDTAFLPGQLWLDTVDLTSFQFSGVSWIALGTGATGGVVTLTGNSGGAISPSAGNINIVGTANQLASTGSGSTITFALSSTLIAPGSLAVTTTLNVTGLTTLAALTAVGTANINASGSAVTTIGTGGTGAVHIGNATGNTAVTGSLTASTTLTATLGAITATNGNLVLGTIGNKIIIPTGTNASAGTSGVMSGTPGAVTVATTACSATAKVFYCRATTGGTPGQVSITAQDGTGFTLTSTGNETSTFNWWIINA
jgi:fibronectin-binding autotransporter adhesin